MATKVTAGVDVILWEYKKNLVSDGISYLQQTTHIKVVP